MVYSSASSANTVKHIHDTIVGLVQPAEVDGTEVDGPDGVGDLLEADDVTLEETADEDLPSIPTESGVSGDSTEFEVARVLEWIGTMGERLFGVSIHGGRGFHVQRLMRTFAVIDSTESIERALLGS